MHSCATLGYAAVFATLLCCLAPVGLHGPGATAQNVVEGGAADMQKNDRVAVHRSPGNSQPAKGLET
jgi:hypothetical protein